MITPLHRFYQSLVARSAPKPLDNGMPNPVDALKARLGGEENGMPNAAAEGSGVVGRSFADVLGRSLSGIEASNGPIPHERALSATASPAALNGPATFPQMAKNTLLKVDQQTKTAAEAVTQVILGKTENLAQVMLAQKEANLSLTYLIELTNHLKSGFKELLKMEA